MSANISLVYQHCGYKKKSPTSTVSRLLYSRRKKIMMSSWFIHTLKARALSYTLFMFHRYFSDVLRSANQHMQTRHTILSTAVYGVVPKGLLTLLCSLYKEVAKTTSGTLMYPFEKQTARKNFSSFEKHCVLDLECRILSQEIQVAAFCILMSYFMESKLKKISIDSC